MRKKALQVTLDVREPSVVELTVGERVQLDRLARSHDGYIAERHGGLLKNGTTTVELVPGHYFFKTLSNANLKVVRGGVVTGAITAHGKNPWPLPPPVVAPSVGGDEPAGEAPILTVE